MILFWVMRGARCERFPGSESPLSLPVYAWPPSSAFLMDSAVIRTVFAPGISALPAAGTSTADSPIASGEGRLLETGLLGCPYRFRRTNVCRWKPGIWLAGASSSVSGAGGSSGVGPTSQLFTNVLGGSAGQRTGDGSGYQPTRDADTVTVCYGNCNELGEAGVGWSPTRPTTAYQDFPKNNRHNPVMVCNDLMIRYNTVSYYNTNWSQPVIVQCINT